MSSNLEFFSRLYLVFDVKKIAGCYATIEKVLVDGTIIGAQ